MSRPTVANGTKAAPPAPAPTFRSMLKFCSLLELSVHVRTFCPATATAGMKAPTRLRASRTIRIAARIIHLREGSSMHFLAQPIPHQPERLQLGVYHRHRLHRTTVAISASDHLHVHLWRCRDGDGNGGPRGRRGRWWRRRDGPRLRVRWGRGRRWRRRDSPEPEQPMPACQFLRGEGWGRIACGAIDAVSWIVAAEDVERMRPREVDEPIAPREARDPREVVHCRRAHGNPLGLVGDRSEEHTSEL